MVSTNHPHSCRTLNHLNLFTKLKTDSLSLVNMKVDCVLCSSIVTWAYRLTIWIIIVTHSHSHSMIWVTGRGNRRRVVVIHWRNWRICHSAIGWSYHHWKPCIILIAGSNRYRGIVGDSIWTLPGHERSWGRHWFCTVASHMLGCSLCVITVDVRHEGSGQAARINTFRRWYICCRVGWKRAN